MDRTQSNIELFKEQNFKQEGSWIWNIVCPTSITPPSIQEADSLINKVPNFQTFLLKKIPEWFHVYCLWLTLEFISSWGKLNALWHRSLWKTCHVCALHSVAKVFVERWIFLFLWMISVLSLLLQIKLLKLSEEKKYQKKVVVRIIKYLSAKITSFQTDWINLKE